MTDYDALEKQVRELGDYSVMADLPIVEITARCSKAADAIRDLRAERDALQKALTEYGRHWSGCGFSGQPCDCGLDAALAAEKEQPHD